MKTFHKLILPAASSTYHLIITFQSGAKLRLAGSEINLAQDSGRFIEEQVRAFKSSNPTSGRIDTFQISESGA